MDLQVAICNKKVNNAIIENRNKIIKCIKNNANGYTNWLRFHNRLILNICTRSKCNIQPGAKREIIMDAQGIIELIEYFRKLQNDELEFQIKELLGYIDIRFEGLYDRLTEYIDLNYSDSNHPL